MKHAVVALLWAAALLPGQSNEVALTLGGIPRTTRGAARIEPGMALQANYGHRLYKAGPVTLLGEVHVLSSPLREVSSANPLATRDVATLYITPGLRLRLLSGRRVSPYAVIGGGYALYEQSTQRLDGSANAAPRLTHRGALQFGGGVDVAVWRWLAVRGEVRDFYTGNPSLNLPLRGGWHNVVASGGLVWRWGARD
jgi:opacity protein-like surface antigen